MDTNALKKFAQEARRQLIAQVSSKLAKVLADGSSARRESADAVKELEKEIARADEDQVIERVAYTWFNRFTALRFMDANGYTGVKVVSPADGQTRPEILAEAVAGVIDDIIPKAVRERVSGLLDGKISSPDAQAEVYALLVVASCNQWHSTMPFLFEKIADYSELLMPDDLLSVDSVLTKMRATMTEDACQDVEIIGWLYQFYISEKKDQVFAGMKKNIKITAENIPAATQLFTPHWIVRYLVENSLGRLWLLNRPQSKLAAQMDYYIAPEEPETDFLRISGPEEIRICDPAAGSGHMLTYAFDLLHAIYEEEGYEPTEIPALILTHNLHGVEIDDRAGALAAFALVMKAAAKLGRRRFLRLGVQPKIYVMEDVRFTPAEMQDVAAVVGRDLFTADLTETLGQFDQAKNFGSLIVPKLRDPAETLRVVKARDFGGDLLLKEVQERVVSVLRMAEALAPEYHIVVANPPYAATKGLNTIFQNFAKVCYPTGKTEVFAMFMVRCQNMIKTNGIWGMINLPSWLFGSTFADLRSLFLSKCAISSALHMGRGNFGIDWGSVAFVTRPQSHKKLQGDFFRLHERNFQYIDPTDISKIFRAALRDEEFRFDFKEYNTNDAFEGARKGSIGKRIRFRCHEEKFSKIPGSPIAYWLSDTMIQAFNAAPAVSETIGLKAGLSTGDNTVFQRHWFEVSTSRISFSSTHDIIENVKWFPCHSGGNYRKWYGNHDVVINWENRGQDIKNFGSQEGRIRSAVRNENFYFRRGITWSKISSGKFDARFRPEGFIFDDTGRSGFAEDHTDEIGVLGLFCSTTANEMLTILSPSMSFTSTELGFLPYDKKLARGAISGVETLVKYAKSDWDAYETSWDFTTLPLLAPMHRVETLAASYASLRAHWQAITDEMQRLEEENNRIFIDAYGLQDELTPDVPLEEITLTCNPSYRYGGKSAVEELETRLRADTMAEFLHYAVGCMFGRYSLDAPGLILASQGEGLADYLARVPGPSFDVDADNVIPVLEGDWFADDISDRFRKLLRATFGEAKFQENLSFIEATLGKDIRKWFTKDFFDYHVRRYKKRPIYWMFSSPKGTFNALIYMHRYTPDTVNVVLNEYVRPFRHKLEAHRADLEKAKDSPDKTPAQQAKAAKEILSVSGQIEELDKWERDVIFPLATRKVAIDLDDGVKANYPKFGTALKTIKGMDAADE